jgi:uncharacterized protein YggE
MQPAQRPAGVKVFGSAVIRVEPDAVSLQFAVSRSSPKPRDAFRDTKEIVKAVRAYLAKVPACEVAASRITLAQNFDFTGGQRRSAGYAARVGFNVLLADLDRMEEILTGVVDAGATEVGAVEFRTSRLKEVRADARRWAVDAARAKAENYCRAAGVTLGPVTFIEDIHPDALRGSGEGSTTTEAPADDGDSGRALTPSSIAIGAAVSVTFAIGG